MQTSPSSTTAHFEYVLPADLPDLERRAFGLIASQAGRHGERWVCVDANALADGLSISYNQATFLIRRLVALGLIARRPFGFYAVTAPYARKGVDR